MMERIKAAVRAHREFVLVLVLAVAFRAMAVLAFKLGGYLGEISDFMFFRILADFANQGFYPLVHYWLEYPPVFPWLMVGVYRLSLLIPAWTTPGTWFYLLLGWVFVAVEAGNLVAVYALALRLHGREQGVRVAWIYSALIIPVFVLLGWFDALPLLFLLLAVLWSLDRRPAAAGLAAGIGFMTKVTPVVALPAAWLYLKGRSARARLALAALLAVGLIAAPFLAVGPEHLIAALTNSGVRSPWETVWALIDGYYSFGIAGGWDRFDPAMAGAAQPPDRIPWPLVTAAFGLLYLFLVTRRVDWREPRRAVAFAALTLNLLLLYSRGYSPQFLVMLLPFVLLLIPGWRGVAYVLLLSALNLAELPVFFVLLPDWPWLLGGTVILRTLIVLILSLEYAAQVYSWRVAERTWSRVAAGAAVLVLVAGLAGAFFGLRAYAGSRYQASAHRPAMDALTSEAAPGATIVAGDQVAYEHLYPYLHRRFRVVEVEPLSYFPAWEPRLAQAAERSAGELWIYAPADSPLHGWPAGRLVLAADHSFEGWRLTGWKKP